MKRFLVAAAAAAAAAVLGVTSASAAVTFDPSSLSGFIGRGDVIAAGGKAALIPNPLVTYTRTTRDQLTCSWSNGTQLVVPLPTEFFVLFQAETRYAANGTITGYTVSRSDILDGEIQPAVPLETICAGQAGAPADGGSLIVTDDVVSTSWSLVFFGPAGGLTLLSSTPQPR